MVIVNHPPTVGGARVVERGVEVTVPATPADSLWG